MLKLEGVKILLFVALVESDATKLKELAETARNLGAVEGVRVISAYGTPVGRGVTIFEADNEEAIFRYYTPMLPFLKKVEIYPALPLEKVISFAPRE
jgi:hypothetical protein